MKNVSRIQLRSALLVFVLVALAFTAFGVASATGAGHSLAATAIEYGLIP
jgi:hypothetical protein